MLTTTFVTGSGKEVFLGFRSCKLVIVNAEHSGFLEASPQFRGRVAF